MAPYDSDSDDGYDPQDYTETDVLLGYVSKDPKGETISRLGGRPVCFYTSLLSSSRLPSLLFTNPSSSSPTRHG